MMRVLRVARQYGQSPAQVMDWSAEDFTWAEALNSYDQAQADAMQKHRRR